MEAARAKKSKLMSSQKEESDYMQGLSDWIPGEDIRASTDRVPLQSRQDKVRQINTTVEIRLFAV